MSRASTEALSRASTEELLLELRRRIIAPRDRRHNTWEHEMGHVYASEHASSGISDEELALRSRDEISAAGLSPETIAQLGEHLSTSRNQTFTASGSPT